MKKSSYIGIYFRSYIDGHHTGLKLSDFASYKKEPWTGQVIYIPGIPPVHLSGLTSDLINKRVFHQKLVIDQLLPEKITTVKCT